MESITWVNAFDLSPCAAQAVFPLFWKQRYSFPDGVSCNGVDIVEVFFVTYWCGL